MTKKEKENIKSEIKSLTNYLNSIKANRDISIEEERWNDSAYWKGRIDQTTETINYLHILTNWEFYK